MRFGVVLLSLAVFEIMALLFGYIAPNSFVGVLLGSGNWIDFIQVSALMDSLILGTTAVVGIYLKNNLLVFGGITYFLMKTIFGINGIIAYFPEPVGHIIFGLMSLIFIWTALEWWRTNDN